MVMKERRGEVVVRSAIKNVCQMLMVLGINSRSVYEEDFERPFLQQSAEFYKVTNISWLSPPSANIISGVTHLKYVEKSSGKVGWKSWNYWRRYGFVFITAIQATFFWVHSRKEYFKSTLTYRCFAGQSQFHVKKFLFNHVSKNVSNFLFSKILKTFYFGLEKRENHLVVNVQQANLLKWSDCRCVRSSTVGLSTHSILLTLDLGHCIFLNDENVFVKNVI